MSRCIGTGEGSLRQPLPIWLRPRPRNSTNPRSRKTCPSTDGLPDFVGYVRVAGMQLLQLSRECVNALKGKLFLQKSGEPESQITRISRVSLLY